MITGAAELEKKFRIWIESGGSSENFAAIATTLDAAQAITDILVNMRSIGMQLVRVGNDVWRIVDNRQKEVVTFRFLEKPVGGADVTIM